ncbi:MAG TPA: hypothetical protein VFS67_24205, partial [Polyangiaceae bacterium]|nr:hypothetical protein [Polyangiaceae bacterium]
MGHEGARALLTGSAADGSNASIDQFLALERGLGAGTPHELAGARRRQRPDRGGLEHLLAGGGPPAQAHR